VHDFTPISYTGADGLALHARDYAAAGDPAAGAPAAGGPTRLPVVCLHGLTRNASDFEEFAPRVAALGRRVLAPDVRGRGHSARDRNTANYSTRVYVQDVVRLMEFLGLERAVFVGTSMGGIITMMLADSRIDLVAGAVLNDIGPDIAEAGLARIAGYVCRPVAASNWLDAAARIRDINACVFPDYDEVQWLRWARRVYKPDSAGELVARYDPAVGLALQDPKRRTTTSPELQRAFTTLARGRPVLLVRGALSDLLEPQHAAAMLAAAPTLGYVEVPNVGHAPMLTEAPAFDTIAAFLAHLP
jgi:pimeloyl-ACP methyl ester carboxylesterase